MKKTFKAGDVTWVTREELMRDINHQASHPGDHAMKKDAFKAALHGTWLTREDDAPPLSPTPRGKQRAVRLEMKRRALEYMERTMTADPPASDALKYEQLAREVAALQDRADDCAAETIRRLDAVVALLLRECPLANLLRAVRETEGEQ